MIKDIEKIRGRKVAEVIIRIEKNHYLKPIDYIKKISDRLGLNFFELIDFYLDEYNDAARERYVLYGENSLEPRYKKECMNMAFTSTLCLMGYHQILRADEHARKLLEEL